MVLGRPDNPTGAFDPVSTIERLARPGRTLVVDEAFVDFLDDAGGIADRADLPGVVTVRSLTKLWGLAGLRVGYVVGPAALIGTLRSARQPWGCNSLALTAAEAVLGAEDERRARAADVAARRLDLVRNLRSVPALDVWASPANFVLLRSPWPDLHDRLLGHGLAARRADTFGGLDGHVVRIAVRDRHVNDRLVAALHDLHHVGG